MAVAARIAKAIVVAVVLAIVGYGLAGLVGGTIPSNNGWRPPAQGVTIYVESNGIHTGIVMPKVAAGIDWRTRVPGHDLADPRYAGFDHVAFGWGERTFYLETPTWADVRPRTILAAAIGSDATLVHVEHLPRPTPSKDVRAVVLRESEYRALAHYVAATFASGAAVHGYANYDAFYPARGHYDAARTCNAWTGDALRAAGVRVGVWTPFPATVMAWF